MTFIETDLEIINYQVQQAREWERTRYHMTLLYNINAKEGKQIKPQKLLPLPTDVNYIDTIDSDEEWDAVWDWLDDFDKIETKKISVN